MVAAMTSVSRSDSFLELVRQFPLRPLRSAAAHRRARVAYRTVAKQPRTSETNDYLKVLGSLIYEYETPIRERLLSVKFTAADVVEFHLDQHGMSVNALAQKTGIAQSALSQMLRGKRGWSKSAIIKLSKFFKIDPGIFLR